MPFLSTCMFLCVYCCANAQRTLADSLFLSKDYLSAAVAYEWAIFSEQVSKSRQNDLLIKKSDCYFMMGHYQKALEVLNRGSFFNQDDTETLKLLYTKYILTAYLAGDANLAYHKLLQAEFTLGDSIPEGIVKIKPFVLIDLGQFNEAQESVLKLGAWVHDSVNLTRLKNIIDETELKDSNKAVNISYLLPGLGMFYTKNFGKGILSATIQSAAAGYGLYGLLTGYFFTASIPGIGLLFTFYSGGARYAGLLADRWNERAMSSWKKELGKSVY